jgi:hypothetical protein
VFGDFDPSEPLDTVSAVETWNDKASREPVLCRQRAAVHLVSDQYILADTSDWKILKVRIHDNPAKLAVVRSDRRKLKKSTDDI